MSLKTIAIAAAGVALLVIGFAIGAFAAADGNLGGSTSYDETHQVGDVRQGLADTLMMQNGELVGPIDTAHDATFGGDLTITTSNAATSTASVGCIQTTATSTATPIRLTIGSTPQATTTFKGTTSNFFVLAQYGTCP